MPEAPPARRNVYVFGITSFLNDTASEMAYWILPSFLRTIGAGPLHLGLIEGIAESVASVGKLYSGFLADRLPRRKPLVVGGYAVANLVKPLLAVVTSWWQVLLIRFADRSAKGIRQTPRDVMLAESVPRANLGSAFGLLQAMDSAGAIVGPLLALWIVSQWDQRTVFWAAAIPGALAIIVISVFARETRAARTLEKQPPPVGPFPAGESAGRLDAPLPPETSVAGTPAARIPRSFYFLLGVVTLFSLGNSSDMFLVLRAQEAGIDVILAPLLGLVFNLTYTAFSWPAGKLSDRLPRNWVAAAGYLVFAGTYFVFAQAPSTAAIWIAMGSYGLFYALTQPVLRALVADAVPAGARGRALGIFHFSVSIAMLLASVLTGFLWSRFGGALPLFISSGLAAVSAVLLLLYAPRTGRTAPAL